MVESILASCLLMLMLLHLRFSGGFAYQDEESAEPASKRREFKKDKSPGYVREEIYDGVPAVAEVGGAGSFVRGRKTLFSKGLAEVAKLKRLHAEDSEIPDAAYSNCRNCEHRRKIVFDLNHNFNRRELPHHSPVLNAKLAAGFLSFNADYHVPRPHPPKNN